MTAKRVVIHRDRTFEYDGQTWTILGGGPGWGYELWCEESGVSVDSFFTFAEIREYVNESLEKNWPLGEL